MMKQTVLLRSFFGYLLIALSLAACVTINIYFPAAAAEEAARVIVRDVLGDEANPDQPQKSQPEAQQEDDQSFYQFNSTKLTSAAEKILNFVIPPAHAAQPNIDISSPSIRKLRASMSKRQSRLTGFYRSGALGFTNKGLITIRELKKIPLKDRNRVKKLVADENGDRNSLYTEIARANGHPEWEQSIRDIFARVWIEEAPKGYWYQNSKGKWQRSK
ncbi:MAG: YdbL family protein [Candidatus Thiodiazotropha sp. (ex. Lucinisca nassula)]|nr:YdbL family protein [Candidatus Thiodiazotropha sp. (ex. Lucinisca nassula)]MBW9261999.1 YdbL family protein [Candidatus Thiodiazotropha sp. (ex. Lucinisca nassula)]